MRRPNGTVILLSAILLLLLPAAVDVATGSLPDAWQPYLWLAWPFAALLVIPVLLVEARSRRPGIRPAGAAGLAGDVLSRALEEPARRELPRDLPDFTDRLPEIDRLVAALGRTGSTVAAVQVSAIHGMAGVGKTALAVHVAHRLAAQFPEGQLFVDLHGFSPGVPPAEAADALDTLLRAVGVPAGKVPSSLTDRERLYRHVLATRRVLVVLDNAATEQHVRPLLPGAAGCAVLVTSRRHLTGLEGAHHLALDVLDDDGAAEMFTKIVGEPWLSDRPSWLADAAELCGNLPLALRIVGARAAARPRWATTLVQTLRDKRSFLAQMRTGELNVEAAFSVSYEHLPPSAQRTFRLLGLHPGIDFDAAAAAALCRVERSTIEDALEPLLDAHLLEEPVPERYRFHDLIREHARNVVAEAEPPAARHAAVGRLVAHYLYQAAAAAVLLNPDIRRVVEWSPAPATAARRFAGYDEALGWYEGERLNLVASIIQAAELGLDEHTWRLACMLYPYFFLRGFIDEWKATHELALVAARRVGNRLAEADILASLGILSRRRGRYQDAVEYQQQALARYGDEHDHHWVMITLTHLGIAYRRLGQYQDAVACHEQALRMHSQLDDRHGEAMTLTNLGLIYQRLGRYRDSIDSNTRALGIARDTTDRHGEAMSLTNLGIVHQRLREHDTALGYHRSALSLSRTIGDRHVEGHVLNNMGVVLVAMGNAREALELHAKGLVLLRQTGSRGDECEALNDIGNASRTCDRIADALAHHQQAHALAKQIGDRYEIGRALAGIAATLDDADPARRDHLTEALEIFTDLCVPEAAVVRRRLEASA